MSQRNTTMLVNLLKKNLINIDSLTKKERKAVQKSMSVTDEVRKFQSENAIQNNEYNYK